MKIRIENEWGDQIIIDGDIKAIYYVDAEDETVGDMLKGLKMFGYSKLWRFSSWRNMYLAGVEPETDKEVDRILKKNGITYKTSEEEVSEE